MKNLPKYQDTKIMQQETCKIIFTLKIIKIIGKIFQDKEIQLFLNKLISQEIRR